jgi:hypothetical protein
MKNNEKVIQQRIWIFLLLNEREIENRWKNESGKKTGKILENSRKCVWKTCSIFFINKVENAVSKAVFLLYALNVEF